MLSSAPAQASTMPYRPDAARAGGFRSMPATNSGMLIGDEKWMSLNLQARSSLTFRREAVRKTTGVRCNVGSDSIYLELSQLKSTLREGVLKILSSIRSDLLVGRRRLF